VGAPELVRTQDDKREVREEGELERPERRSSELAVERRRVDKRGGA
jgi:hypothetical protein